MKQFEKKLQKVRYTIPGNGAVVDDKDAAEIARMAYNEALDEIISVLKDPIGELRMGMTTIEWIKHMKYGTITSNNHSKES
jgi:hypothetical protein